MRFFRRKDRPEPPQWVVVRSSLPHLEGEVACGLLASAGIEVKMRSADALPRGRIGPTRVTLLVTEDRYDEAVALLPE